MHSTDATAREMAGRKGGTAGWRDTAGANCESACLVGQALRPTVPPPQKKVDLLSVSYHWPQSIPWFDAKLRGGLRLASEGASESSRIDSETTEENQRAREGEPHVLADPGLA